MSCLSTENGTKVNMIKQKFERKNGTSNEENEDITKEEEQKDPLRRSLSASPVKAKKNLKLNVTRQLSNPGKNIKRTPAFRGDKLIRTKNLNSPGKEKVISIVNQNVKMFEEKPEYGKIGNVKKKEDSSSPEIIGNDVTDFVEKKRILNSRPPLTKDKTKIGDNKVRTTVISRQKNISPLYTLDDDFVPTIIKIEEDKPCDSTNGFDKFIMNGAEYTKVSKSTTCSDEKKIEKMSENFSIDNRIESVDICDDTSKGIFEYEENLRLKLTDSLKAALQAPLPSGPPPKKPPRTFAHSPLSHRSRLNNSDGNLKATSSSEESQKDIFCIDELVPSKKSTNHYEIMQSDEDLNEFQELSSSEMKTRRLKNIEPTKTCSFMSGNNHELTSKSRSTRDSKKMLEKLETVLSQHQKALGPKVIVPRVEKNQMKIGFDSRKKTQSDSESVMDKREKRAYHNRLPNTLEDSKKHGSLNKIHDTKTRKPSAFDCLPYLNCASSTVYEQPNFKNYLTENGLKDVKSKSEHSLDSSISNIISSNNDLYDDNLCPASKRLSIELTTFLDSKKRQSALMKSEERVYAEPFAFDKNSGTDITGLSELSPEEHNYLSRSWLRKKISDKPEGIESPGRNNKELHYLCTTIDQGVLEYNNNGPEDSRKSSCDPVNFENFFERTNSPIRPSLDGLDRMKVNELLNKAFGQFVMAGTELSTDSNPSSDTDSLASTPSIGEESTSFNEKLRLFKNRESNLKTSKEELQRSLTEKRKHYVRRVSIKYSENREPSLRGKRDRLFEVCLLVELNLSTRKPYIKDKYPVYANSPDWIENFCFPDAQNWPPTDSNSNQFYSLFLMDEKGNRRYGYCCRVKPENGPILPLAYCLITKYRASGFYRKVLQELESRHGLPNKRRRNFIEELYNSPMPKPGNSLKMMTEKFQFPDEHNSSNNNNDALLKLKDGSAECSIESDNCASIIMRSGDPRLDERDMIQLFDAVSNKVLIYLFGCLLLERRVVLISNKLSKLSCCVEALQSLLYPFTWPHTFIPVLPDIPGLDTILEAPLPFVIGILKSQNSATSEVANIQDGIVVDLDTSKIICAVGDESTILPSRLQKGIKSALQLVTKNNKPGDEVRNFLVSEAFLRVFIETCAHLEGHLVTQQDGKVIFQKESFIKASSSKTVQYFLEWFVETTMFNAFVADYISWIEGKTVKEKDDIKLFSQRVAEYQKSADKSAQPKNNSKKKTLGDRLKDLTNFYT